MDNSKETYDFDEDATGLANFIYEQLEAQDDNTSPVVYVVDAVGANAVRADWVTSTLTDGSKVCTLTIHFSEI